MTYSIYMRTCKTTNKSYIGLTSGAEELRWKQHVARAIYYKDNYKLDNAIRAYGADNWEVEILDTDLTFTEAKMREIYFIGLYDTYRYGYNSTIGGDNSRPAKPVVAIDIKTGDYKVFASITDADAEFTHVGNVLAGDQSHSRGHTFVLLSEFNPDDIQSYIAPFVAKTAAKEPKIGKRWSYEVEGADGVRLEFQTLEEVAAKVGSSITTIYRRVKDNAPINGYNIYKKLS